MIVPIDILRRRNGVRDEMRVYLGHTVQGHLYDDAVRVRIIVKFVQLREQLVLRRGFGQLHVGRLYADLARGLDLHANIHIGVLAAAHLDDRQAGLVVGQFFSERGDILCQGLTNFSVGGNVLQVRTLFRGSRSFLGNGVIDPRERMDYKGRAGNIAIKGLCLYSCFFFNDFRVE